MEQRRLGSSGLTVSEFALGAMTFENPIWGCDEATSVELIERYLDAGGNTIDTADAYSGGASEEIVGKALQGRRSEVVIATKFGLPTGPGPHDRGAGRHHVVRACEASLRRLQTDYIDLYQLHVDDSSTPLEETISALDDLVRSGKVRYVGASNMAGYRLMKALSIADRRGAARFVSFQAQYNMIVRELEREHLALLAEEGLGLIAWSPLAGGMLTGKITRDTRPEGTRMHGRETGLEPMYMHERGFTIVDRVNEVAAELDCTPAQLALAWQRTRPVASTIVGARTHDQLEQNLAALEITVPPEVLADLDEVSQLPQEYPWTFIERFQGVLRGQWPLSTPTEEK